MEIQVKNCAKARLWLYVIDDGNNWMLEVRVEKVSNCRLE